MMEDDGIELRSDILSAREIRILPMCWKGQSVIYIELTRYSLSWVNIATRTKKSFRGVADTCMIIGMDLMVLLFWLNPSHWLQVPQEA